MNRLGGELDRRRLDPTPNQGQIIAREDAAGSSGHRDEYLDLRETRRLHGPLTQPSSKWVSGTDYQGTHRADHQPTRRREFIAGQGATLVKGFRFHASNF